MPEASPGRTGEIDTGGRGLRAHAARGTLINSAFQIGLAALGFLRRVLIAAFLTRAEFGVWGIIITTLITLAWLKDLGIADKYVQQNEDDQEAAFQKAFTLELALSTGFFLLLCAAMPIYGLAYGHTEIILPGIVLALSVPLSAFESPIWIPYRRMQFVRQRSLAAIDPVVAFVVTMVAGALGAGYWCLVAGSVAGSLVGGLVATLTSPYRVRLRFERSTLKEYASFSWPLLGYQVANLVGIQGVLLAASHAVGLANVGSIGLAASISAFADRVDAVVSGTIYPAVCAVADRVDMLFEAFVTSNRLALMWGMPFGAGLALFSGDLVHFVLGERWRPAVGLLAVFGLTAGFAQIGFNWQIFLRAVNRTRPMFQAAILNLVVMLGLTIPLMFAFGVTGYAIGMAGSVLVQVLQRGYYLRQLFTGFRITGQMARAILPSVPAAGVVLLARLALGDHAHALGWVIALLALYVVATLAATWVFERDMISEMAGYLRGGGGIRAKAEGTA